MNIPLWVAEGLLLNNCGWVFARSYLGYRGIQSVLWPVTLTVRAIARDPLRDLPPLKADPARVAALEKELGIGQEKPQKAVSGLDKLMVLEQPRQTPRAPSGRTLAHSSLTLADERDTVAALTESLKSQVPNTEIWQAYRRAHMEMLRSSSEVWGTVRWMQAYVCRHGVQGYEEHPGTAEDLQERYDELRKDLRDSLRSKDKLMVENARRRLTQWCARHHDPRTGRVFPMPDWHTYRHWTDDDDAQRWRNAFDGFQ